MFVVMVFALLVDFYDYDTGATGASRSLIIDRSASTAAKVW
jgi:hypothetical protein